VGGLTEQLGDEPLATLCDPDAASLTDTIAGLLHSPRAVPGAAAVDPRAGWRAVAESLRLEFAHLLLSGRDGPRVAERPRFAG
jgi:hypothetical protein